MTLDQNYKTFQMNDWVNIAVAINETIKIMKQIDETITAHGGWL